MSVCYANRQLHYTNYIQAREQPDLGALTQSGPTSSLSARLNVSDRAQRVQKCEYNLFHLIKKVQSAKCSFSQNIQTQRPTATPLPADKRQCGNFRSVSGPHKGNTHTLTKPDMRYIKEAWRIGLRLNYCLMLSTCERKGLWGEKEKRQRVWLRETDRKDRDKMNWFDQLLHLQQCNIM